ncbi:hypothetical protein TYRP_022694, partial [Tyrophagus putrescentiae]
MSHQQLNTEKPWIFILRGMFYFQDQPYDVMYSYSCRPTDHPCIFNYQTVLLQAPAQKACAFVFSKVYVFAASSYPRCTATLLRVQQLPHYAFY